jgi:hypothetical protein
MSTNDLINMDPMDVVADSVSTDISTSGKVNVCIHKIMLCQHAVQSTSTTQVQNTTRTMYASEKQAQNALNAMNQMRRDDELCDVVLVVGSNKMPCHRIVLAANSQYFRVMFTGQMAEADKCWRAICVTIIYLCYSGNPYW